MFPIPLLPTVPDNLQDMKARSALLYQNTFMKNALIRALNITYDMAPKMNGRHAEFPSFIKYVETVYKMLDLHLEGDDVFFEALARQCSELSVMKHEVESKVRKDINSLLLLVEKWNRSPDLYQPNGLQDELKNMELSFIEVLHSQMYRFKGDILPKSIDDEGLSVLVRENMIWFGSRVDISILLPFCVSHHDPQTSKYWPPITADAIGAIPDLAAVHPDLWRFAPFHPVTRDALPVAL